MRIREHTGRSLTQIAWIAAIALAVASCSLSNIPIEPAGAPSSTQDNDSSGGGGY